MKKHLLLIALLGIGSATMWAGPIDCSELEGLKGDEIPLSAADIAADRLRTHAGCSDCPQLPGRFLCRLSPWEWSGGSAGGGRRYFYQRF